MLFLVTMGTSEVASKCYLSRTSAVLWVAVGANPDSLHPQTTSRKRTNTHLSRQSSVQANIKHHHLFIEDGHIIPSEKQR